MTSDNQEPGTPFRPDETIQLSTEMLCAARAAHRASLVVLSGWEIGREIQLTEPETIFGRSPEVGVQIVSPSMSRQHARIARQRDEDGAFHFEVVDLQSLNGTQVNSSTISTARLKHGDTIQMGDVVFRFLLADPLDAQFYRDVYRRIHYDSLTGLMTLESFRRRMEAEIGKGADAGPFVIAMTDLDGLKRVNDTYGHLAGRMVVREMGVMLRQCLREHDLGGLYGGDETVLLFAHATLDIARDVAETIRKTIADRVFEFGEHRFSVTISQGLAEWPQHGASVELIIAAADKALYAAKHAGRNCVCVAGE